MRKIHEMGMLVLMLFFAQFINAQQNYNLTQLSNLTYNADLSDIWGYAASDGTEYALVGVRNGTSVVSLADPANPVEVYFVPGANSIWRDLKTWGDFAYVTTDQGADGLLILDLSGAPNAITHQFWKPELTIGGSTDTLERAHNLYIDENGYCYIAGSNINVGETFILDVHTTPGTPIFMSATDPFYAHDAYARGDSLYTSDINDGFFSIYDVSDKLNPILLAQQETPFFFTHNAWISDDGNTLFTTDEKPDAYIGSYDISDVNDIKEIDVWRPFETEGEGVIPHNVHVLDDYIIISYYTDGVIVLDASDPSNLVEVAKYDTYPFQNTGFFGAWGAYPFFPSGLVAVSDINTGLHIFNPNYQRGCRLEGKVTEQGTGVEIFDVLITLDATPVYTNSDVVGDYKTGIGQAGTYDVTYTKAGYQSKTVTVTLQNGQVVVEDVELVSLTPFSITGNVNAFTSGTGIEDAVVTFESDLYDFDVTTDANGDFTINNVFQDDYTIVVGAWGYHTQEIENVPVNAGSGNLTYTLNNGYRDEFALDLGWTVTGNAGSGNWELAEPEGVFFNGQDVAPDEDISGDIGEMAYVTGNDDGGQYGSDDVDNGETILTSPVFDLTGYIEPYVSYQYWFVNEGGGSTGNDSLLVTLDNGLTTAEIALYQVNESTYAWSAMESFKISDYITPTANMQISFQTADRNGSGHIVEAGIDMFEVMDSTVISVEEFEALNNQINLYPNPVQDILTIEYAKTENTVLNGVIYNNLGQAVEQIQLVGKEGQLQINIAQLSAGMYWLKVEDQSLPFVKE